MRLLHHVGLIPFLIYSVWRLTELMRHYRIDLVHTNSLVIIDGALAARLSGVPHVWHAREVFTEDSPYHFLFGHLGHRIALSLIDYLSDRIIAISSAVGHSLGHTDRLFRSIVVYNAVEVSVTETSAARERIRQMLNIPNGVHLVGEVARLAPIKGYDDYVRAAAQVHQEMPNTRFVAVGDALSEAYQQSISELIARLGMDQDIILMGFRHDVADIMGALDLLVLPSHYEPFGRVLVEAMAAGKPVIGTKVGGIPEIIENGTNGLLVAPGSPDALAGAIIRILQDPDMARRMGAAGRQLAKARFGPERYVAQIQDAYEGLIEKE